MATYGFRSTLLWTSTLAEVDDDPNGEHREHLRSTFLRAREATGLLLGELGASVPEYTVHDLSHADALWETASLLIGPEVAVNPVEGFVLGMAFLLHDAAMGLAAYQDGPAEVLGEDGWKDLVCSVFREREGRWPSEKELAHPSDEVAAEARSAAVREAHARQAGVLVDTAWTSAEGTPHFLLDDARLRDWYGPVLAELVKSHWWSVEQVSTDLKGVSGSPPWLPDWPLDRLKLACLLRLADATQVDARRAPTLLLLIRRPEGESRQHWRFQQYVNRPQLLGDRMTYTSSRPFAQVDAPAWWLALDYLRGVDGELRSVDDLMHDLGRSRFAARGVAGVGTPARFAELFRVRGWRPVDADVQVSDVRALVAALGGEQLYGRQPEVAVRELIQNAHDAVLARQALEPGFRGSIVVTLSEDDKGWTLEVRDDGIGMDEDVLVGGLMDFGRSGWRSRMVRTKFAGLISSGFRPKGRFGIGFFSVFMLGDHIEVVTRRSDLGRTDARRLLFDGLSTRPLMTPLSAREVAKCGTTVSIRLRIHPYGRGGLLWYNDCSTAGELVQTLVPECDVPILVRDAVPDESVTLKPFRLADAAPAEVFDRLYPSKRNEILRDRRQRNAVRDEFVQRASDVVADPPERLGLAVAGRDLNNWGYPNFAGITVVNGFAADRLDFFTGYLAAEAQRASRDQAKVVAGDRELGRWLRSQQERLRQIGKLTTTRQFDLADLLLRAGHRLDDDPPRRHDPGGAASGRRHFPMGRRARRDHHVLGVAAQLAPRRTVWRGSVALPHRPRLDPARGMDQRHGRRRRLGP